MAPSRETLEPQLMPGQRDEPIARGAIGVPKETPKQTISAGRRRTRGRPAAALSALERMDPQVPPFPVERRQQREAELRHHPPRGRVLLRRDRHDAREAELAERPRDGRLS